MNIALAPGSWCRGESNQTDEALIRGIVEQRPDALCSLYDRYEGLVITIARNVLTDPDDARETLQDVFLLIWNQADRFDPRRGKVKGWISGLTHCRAIDRRRRRSREALARERVREEFERNLTAHFYDTDKTAYFSEAADDGRAVLLDAVASLPSPQAQVLLLTYTRGMSQREIAKHLGITLGVVKHRLTMAMGSMVKMSGRLRRIFAV